MTDLTKIAERTGNFNAFEMLIQSDGPPDPNYVFDYKILRAKEYPPIEDFIDGVVKGDQAQIQEYIDACLSIKNKYPKPE